MTTAGVKEYPDVTGYPADIAGRMLREAGAESVSVVMTAAPFQKQSPAKSVIPAAARVLRQRAVDGGTSVELTVGEF